MSNAQVVKHLYEAFGRGDMGTVLGGMDPAIEWREAESNPYMPSGDPFVGPDAIVSQLFMRLGSEWDGFAVHPKTYHDAGDTVVVEVRYTGTFRATGRGAGTDTQACHVWRFRDGRVVAFQQYADTAKLQYLMGVSATA